MKAKDVRGFMIEPNNDIDNCPDFNRGKNSTLLIQGNREITLNREKLAEVLYMKSNEYPALHILWGFVEDFKKEYYLKDADAIIAAEADILESPTKDKT